jgi:hypothetical protein
MNCILYGHYLAPERKPRSGTVLGFDWKSLNKIEKPYFGVFGHALLNTTGNCQMITDTTFFTNEPGYALLDRFKKTLKHVQYFDVLVGYFKKYRQSCSFN